MGIKLYPTRSNFGHNRYRDKKEPEEIYYNPENFINLSEELLTIDLFGEINGKTTLVFKQYFSKLVRVYKALTRKQEPITITVNSGGGDSSQGLAIHDLIRSCGLPIKTIALGGVESAALVIFLAGSKRHIHENAVLLSHKTFQPDLDVEYTGEQLVSIGKQLLATDELYRKIILRASKITRRKLIELEKSEKFITAEEAVKYGLAHEIIKND